MQWARTIHQQGKIDAQGTGIGLTGGAPPYPGVGQMVDGPACCPVQVKAAQETVACGYGTVVATWARVRSLLAAVCLHP